MAINSEIARRPRQELTSARPGFVQHITDSEVAPKIDSLQASLSSPAKALNFLKSNGFLTKTGRVPKKYGG